MAQKRIKRTDQEWFELIKDCKTSSLKVKTWCEQHGITAKANHLNVFQYLYTLLLYMPDYKEEPAGVEAMMPWSEFIKERCTRVMDTETETPENRGHQDYPRNFRKCKNDRLFIAYEMTKKCPL